MARRPERIRRIRLLGIGRLLDVEVCHFCSAVLVGLGAERHRQWHRELGEALRGEDRR